MLIGWQIAAVSLVEFHAISTHKGKITLRFGKIFKFIGTILFEFNFTDNFSLFFKDFVEVRSNLGWISYDKDGFGYWSIFGSAQLVYQMVIMIQIGLFIVDGVIQSNL